MNKQQVIIFEGCEKKGKTTIAKALSSILQIPYFRYCNNQKHAINNVVSRYTYLDQLYIVDFFKQTKYSIIIDRAYPSDYVYSTAFQHNRNLSNIQLSEKCVLLTTIDAQFASINAKIIYCHNDNKIKDNLFPIDSYDNIQSQYEIFMSTTACHVLRLNTTDENLPQQLITIINWLDEIDK